MIFHITTTTLSFALYALPPWIAVSTYNFLLSSQTKQHYIPHHVSLTSHSLHYL